MDLPSSEQLKELKEIAIPFIALLSLVWNGVMSYLQSKCRRDLDRAYAEISYLNGGERVMRKPWQFWKPKSKRKMVKVEPLECRGKKADPRVSDR